MKRISVIIAALAVAACGSGSDGGGSPPPPGSPPTQPTAEPNPTPAASQATLKILSKPFAGNFTLGNYFDHDRPTGPGIDSSGYQLTWRGQTAYPGGGGVGHDGHTGYDWTMPAGTPVLAVADGTVTFAGLGPAAGCPLQNNDVVAGNVVSIAITPPNGLIFLARYEHLATVAVAANDVVVAGQVIGTSGATGCAGTVGGNPYNHLHLSLLKIDQPVTGLARYIDPYGWQGPGNDPWAVHPSGAASLWMWKDGQAPGLVLN